MLGLNLTTLPDGRKALIMRTSDSIAFKQCRRKWAWSSHLQANLAPKNLAAPLWFGSAIHYALEDYHGYNVYGRPAAAFKAYCLATAKNWQRELPPEARELWVLGQEMMDYYVDYWLEDWGREEMPTYWLDGVPQVEVNFEIPVPLELLPDYVQRWAKEAGIDTILYRGTLDRVGIDEHGQLWVIEYKTAKVAASLHFQTDPQVSRYVWATSLIYDKPVVGVQYEQFVKRVPREPPVLASGKISTAQNLVTSYPLYRRVLRNVYGAVETSPIPNQNHLELLRKSESPSRDRYIIRENIYRNPQQCVHEAQKILLELEDMLNPLLALYPNPTRDCSRMCSFVAPCVNMDDGSDWESLLASQFGSRDQDLERMWRRRLPSPSTLKEQTTDLLTEEEMIPDLEGIQLMSQEEYNLAIKGANMGDEYENWDGSPVEHKDPFKGASEDGSFNMKEVD